jgi:hypothetical protein
MLFLKDCPMTIRYKIIQFQSKVLDSIDAVNCYDYMVSILDNYTYRRREHRWPDIENGRPKNSERNPKVDTIQV